MTINITVEFVFDEKSTPLKCDCPITVYINDAILMSIQLLRHDTLAVLLVLKLGLLMTNQMREFCYKVVLISFLIVLIQWNPVNTDTKGT